jgi:hypothetical protein
MRPPRCVFILCTLCINILDGLRFRADSRLQGSTKSEGKQKQTDNYAPIQRCSTRYYKQQEEVYGTHGHESHVAGVGVRIPLGMFVLHCAVFGRSRLCDGLANHPSNVAYRVFKGWLPGQSA